MVYCLSVRIVTDSQSVIDAIEVKVKARTDAQLWQDDVDWAKMTYADSNGHLVLYGEMRFLEEAEMDTSLTWMKNETNTYEALLISAEGEEPGSYVEAHTCDHRKLFEGTHGAGDACTVTYRWDK